MCSAFESVTSTLRSSIFLALLALAACTTITPEQAAPPVATERVEAAPPQSVLPPEPEPKPRPDKSAFRVSIAAVGDMMIGTDFPENHLPDDDGTGFLAAVTPWLSSADLTFGNLEGVLVDGGEPAKKCKNPSACYLFRSPTRYATHYLNAGFDVLSLANNHARDFGEEGRTSTMTALDQAGILHSGREGDFASIEINNIKIAVLAYAVTKESNMMLAEEEYFGEPRGDVVMFAHRMVDAGADLLIGHGPHVVRAAERYKDRLIAYSLGNFATYYGISVAGIKGIAPILTVTLDGEGRFVEGEVVSTVQLRPDGPSIDEKQRALNLMRGLSIEDFENSGLTFLPDGKLLPANREPAGSIL